MFAVDSSFSTETIS